MFIIRSIYKAIGIVACLCCILMSGCTVVTTTDYIHKETSQLRRFAIHRYGKVELNQKVALIPNFRIFPSSWGGRRRANLWILSDEPAKVYLKSFTLSGPDGTPTVTRNLDNTVNVKKAMSRQTTWSERMATGGIVKGKRMMESGYFSAREPLFIPNSAFKPDFKSLDLKIVASINDGPETTHHFHLRYSSSTHPDFIRR